MWKALLKNTDQDIGCHDNFLKTKDALSRFKDRFWNIMLMLLYMNALLVQQ